MYFQNNFVEIFLILNTTFMENKKMSQLSVDELQKQAKLIKTVLGALIGMSIVLAGAIIFLIIRKGFSAIPVALTVVVSSLLTLCFANKKNLDNIKEEISSREPGN